jgi:hypothetical protein
LTLGAWATVVAAGIVADDMAEVDRLMEELDEEQRLLPAWMGEEKREEEEESAQ